MRNLSRLQNRLLTLGAVLGTLCLLGALTGILLGAKPLVFRSGSMAPAIATGALGVSLPVEAQEIRTGDIISVENAAGVRITHRVVASEPSNGTATVTLKGDANAVADLEPYVLRKADRMVFSVPLLGYGVAWLSSPTAMFVGGLVTAYLLYVAFGSQQGNRQVPRRQKKHPVENNEPNDPPSKVSRRSKRMAATTLASLALVAGGALHASVPGHAAFLDTASATASIAASILQPPALTCTNSGNDVILTLTQPGDFGTQYELKSSPPPKTWTTGSWVQGAIVSVTIDADDPAINHPQARDVTFTAGSKFYNWSSALRSAVVSYTPSVTVVIIGLVPAKLHCAGT